MRTAVMRTLAVWLIVLGAAVYRACSPQDTNYVNALSSNNMEPNRLRRSVLGGLRYGKVGGARPMLAAGSSRNP